MIDEAARILHVMGVIVWVGHNWSNVVHTPVYRPVLPAEPEAAARDVAIAASKREHGIYRYSSVLVLATGLFMLWREGTLADTLAFSGPSLALTLGVWLGLAMVLNLWGVMWPRQQKVLDFVTAPGMCWSAGAPGGRCRSFHSRGPSSSTYCLGPSAAFANFCRFPTAIRCFFCRAVLRVIFHSCR